METEELDRIHEVCRRPDWHLDLDRCEVQELVAVVRAAERLSDTVEDHLYAEGDNTEAMREALQHYYDVSAEPSPVATRP